MDNLIDLGRSKFLNFLQEDANYKWLYPLVSILLFNYKRILEELWEFLKNCWEHKLTQYIVGRNRTRATTKVKTVQLDNEADSSLIWAILKKHRNSFDLIALSGTNEYRPVATRTVTVSENIKLTVSFGKPSKKENEPNSPDKLPAITELLIDFTSENLSVDEIIEFIQNEYIPKSPNIVHKVISPDIPLYDMFVGRVTHYTMKGMHGELISYKMSKQVDNIYLEKDMRERIMTVLKRFEDRNWYAKRGIPRTLGLLLHGVAGCGKTSLIKALCSFTKRRALIVDFKLVKSKEQLRSIFGGTLIDNESDQKQTFNCNSTIYIFEDFDCMSNVFMDRDKLSENQSRDHVIVDGQVNRNEKTMAELTALKQQLKFLHKMQLQNLNSDDKNKKKQKEAHVSEILFDDSTEQVNLADFLELLDGIVEMDGRIIVMTTNKRDLMDNALIRPGRIDLDIEFKPPSRTLICEIFVRMYQDLIEKDKEAIREIFTANYSSIPNGTVSTAKVVNAFMSYDPVVGFKRLKEAETEAESEEESSDIGVDFMVQTSVNKDLIKADWNNAVSAMEKKLIEESKGDENKEQLSLLKSFRMTQSFKVSTKICKLEKVVITGARLQAIITINSEFFVKDETESFDNVQVYLKEDKSSPLCGCHFSIYLPISGSQCDVLLYGHWL